MKLILSVFICFLLFFTLYGCNEQRVCLDGVSYNKKTSCTQQNAVYCYEPDTKNKSCENKKVK